MNYALLSEHKFQVDKKLQSLIEDVKNKYDTEVIDIDGNTKDFNMDSLLNELNTFPFLSEHRLVILSNPIFLSPKGSLDDGLVKDFEQYLNSPADFSTLIIYVDDFKVDNRKKISKVVKKKMEVFEPEALNEQSISRIIQSDLEKHNLKLDYHAKKELDRRLISQFDNWPQELEKLILFNKDTITVNDVDLLITNAYLDNVFDMVNGVLNKDINQSFRVYQSLPASEKEPIALIMLLASQFRLIHQIQTLLNANISFNDLASMLKVHRYRVQVARPIAKRYSSMETLKVLNDLAQLEQNIKNGIVDPIIGFELFLIGASVQ